MKILHIQKVKETSGPQKHLHLLLPRLDPKKFEVHFLILEEKDRPQRDYSALFNGSSVAVTRFTIRRDVDLFLLFKLVLWMRRQKFDLVHTHLLHADTLGAWAAHLAGISRIVSTKHGLDGSEKLKRGERYLLRRCSRFLNGVIAVSEVVRAICETKEKIPREKMTVIYYGRPAVENPQPPDSADFLYLGRLAPEKGCRELLKAFEMVVQSSPQARLFIAGDGPLKEEMDRRVREKGLDRSISLLGYREDVDSLLEKSVALVLPSHGEEGGLPLLEAMAHARPVVATNVSAIPEIVLHGKTGLLVPPRNVFSLSEAMKTLLDDEESSTRMGEAGYRRLKEYFSPEIMVKKTEELYKKMLDR